MRAEIEPDTPAAKAGLQAKAIEIVAVDGKPMVSHRGHDGSAFKKPRRVPIALTVLRGNRDLKFHGSARSFKTEDTEGAEISAGCLNKSETKVTSLAFTAGLIFRFRRTRKFPADSGAGAKDCAGEGYRSIEVSGSHRASRSEKLASGPAKGWTPLLELTSGISLNLGIFNLLPIPILDGGVIFFLLIETLMGHDISLRIKERVYQAAFVFLVLFTVVVIYNDLMKTIPGLMDRLP